MEIKGSAVKFTLDFVKANFYDSYNGWLEELPPVSRLILGEPIYATRWYQLMDAVIIPTQKVGDLFYNGNHTLAAREIGRFSSDAALKGMYKIFVRINTPQFLISRAANIFTTFYRPAEIKVLRASHKKVALQLGSFLPNEQLVIERIAGWIERTLNASVTGIDVEHVKASNTLSARITAVWD